MKLKSIMLNEVVVVLRSGIMPVVEYHILFDSILMKDLK